VRSPSATSPSVAAALETCKRTRCSHLKDSAGSRQQGAPHHPERKRPRGADLPRTAPIRLAVQPHRRPVASYCGIWPLEIGIKRSYKIIFARLLSCQQPFAAAAAGGAADCEKAQSPALSTPPAAIWHPGGPYRRGIRNSCCPNLGGRGRGFNPWRSQSGILDCGGFKQAAARDCPSQLLAKPVLVPATQQARSNAGQQQSAAGQGGGGVCGGGGIRRWLLYSISTAFSLGLPFQLLVHENERHRCTGAQR
jgi:hypothetical protein